MLSFILFFGVVLGLLFLGTRYIWRRLVRDTELTGRTRLAASVLIIGCSILLPVVMVAGRRAPRGPLEFLASPIYTWMGALYYLVLLFWLFDLFRWTSKKGKSLYNRFKPATPETKEEPENPSRRLFLARTGAGIALASTGAAVFIGRANVSGEISTPTIEVLLARLPKALDGFRIVHFTDVHIGPILDRKFLRGLVEKANAMKPDLVVITGDLVDSSPGMIGPEVAELAKLKARFGRFFVTGNHEYYSGAKAWIRYLEKMGIPTLMNQRVSIGDSGASFDLAGIPDKVGRRYSDLHRPDLGAALKGRDPERELLLLAHRPEPIDEAAKHHVGLQLSGHTHGGQLWPSTIVSKWKHTYSTGLHHHTPDTQIYVSRGAGFWGAPMRIAAPAELPLIVLSST
jgi:predicted MPP superfamily phosphohydrolase